MSDPTPGRAVAPSEDMDTDATTSSPRPQADLQRIAIYVVAAVSLCLVLWALVEGGDRDLWSQPSALVHGTRWASGIW